MTNVTIPGSVTNIGDWAFYHCTSLTSLTVGTNVTSIGANAFAETGLTSLTIPASVTSIGTNAFAYCTSLTNVTMGINVTSIGDLAFESCTSLIGVYFEGNAPAADVTVFDDDNNATVYYLPGTSGWSSAFGGVPAVMLNPPNLAGFLQVIITPAEAITAGAQWQVDGGIEQPSGATVLHWRPTEGQTGV